jgi:ATP-binding cassette subfamily B multidrug efflux pump
MRKLLADYLKPYWKQITIVVLLVFVQSIANLILPSLNARIINNGVALGDTGYIVRMGGIMLGVALLTGVTAIVAVYWAAKTAMSVGRDIRGDLFRKVQSFSQLEINQFGAPSLINRNTNDVQQVQLLLAIGFTIMIMAPLMAIGGIIMALRQDIPLSLTLAVILPVMGLFLYLVIRRAIPLFRSMQTRLDRVNQVMREVLSGMRVIRAFAREDYEEARFDQANEDLTETGLRAMRLFAVVFPTLLGIMNF